MIRTTGFALTLLAYVAVSMFGGGLIVCRHDTGQAFLEWASSPCCAPSNRSNAATESAPMSSDTCCSCQCREDVGESDEAVLVIREGTDPCVDQPLVVATATITESSAPPLLSGDDASTAPVLVVLPLLHPSLCSGFSALNCGPPVPLLATVLKNIVIRC